MKFVGIHSNIFVCSTTSSSGVSRRSKAVHLRAGADHAVPVGGDGFGFDSMKLHGAEVLPHHHVPKRGCGSAGRWCRLWCKPGRTARSIYLVGSLNDWLGTNLDAWSPSVPPPLDRQHRDGGVHGLINMLISYSRPRSRTRLYEAASIDGAGEWQRSSCPSSCPN